MKYFSTSFLFLLNVFVYSQPNFNWSNGVVGAWGMSVTVDKENNVYSSGYFTGTCDFDPSSSIYNITATGGSLWDLYICKFDSAGNFLWAKNRPGVLNTNDIFADTSGVLVLNDFELVKYDVSGNFLWTRDIASGCSINAYSMAIDTAKNIYITGRFIGGGDFDSGSGVCTLISNGAYNVFVSKFNSSGNFAWAKKIGGNNEAIAMGIAVDRSNNIFLTGSFREGRISNLCL